VNTVALGDCNSSGAVLLAAGTGKRRAYHDSVIVIHGMEINGKVPRRYIDLSQESYADFWRRRARLPESWLPLPLGKVIFLTPEEAVEYGVIDEIIPPWESGKPEAVGR
jgi:ATP-dependent protease ClpP protease subunit